MLQVFGIKNCNTVKKAIDWLNENKLEYTFNDYKKTPITKEKLIEWNEKLPWEKLINKKGTTWRKLTTEDQAAVTDAKSANQILVKNTSMIKRPLIAGGKQLVVGFDEKEYSSFLK